ncbi:hemolysin family protein [Agilicoccus flavus]|uniref:hemolysin family protein n=1 Tax=Agilicoccus flavus TaxID=2775968 RepID=UPI001CF66950|nr:hemolysin family protein [Agilicoccus flavus]
MSALLSILLGVLIVVVITAFTGYFVAQEFAYMAVDRSRLASRAAQGDDAAERTLTITRRTSFMLSGAQLGITVTGLLVGYVAEPLIGVAVADLLGGSSTGWAVAFGGAIALIFSTIVQMLFGELFPKNYSIARADTVAPWLSRSTKIYLTVFGPVIWVFDKAAEGFLRLLRIEPVHDVEHAASARDLEHVVEASRDSGTMSPELSEMLDRIIDFPRRDVEHAMIPRARVSVVRGDDTVAEVRHLMSGGHTRYPVLDDDDRILGVTNLIDLLRLPADCTDPVSTHVRDALVFSPYMALPDALAQLRESRKELACVVDEYGGFDGIVTIEDLAEEIVGEITDEHDPDDADEEPVYDDGVWLTAGEVHLDEVERALRVDLPRAEYETIAGLVMATHGALPEPGAVVDIPLPVDPDDLLTDDEPEVRRLRAEVLEVDNYVPSRLRLTLPDSEPRPFEDASDAESESHSPSEAEAEAEAEPASDGSAGSIEADGPDGSHAGRPAPEGGATVVARPVDSEEKDR